jgi:hypothetical protein
MSKVEPPKPPASKRKLEELVNSQIELQVKGAWGGCEFEFGNQCERVWSIVVAGGRLIYMCVCITNVNSHSINRLYIQTIKEGGSAGDEDPTFLGDQFFNEEEQIKGQVWPSISVSSPAPLI